MPRVNVGIALICVYLLCALVAHILWWATIDTTGMQGILQATVALAGGLSLAGGLLLMVAHGRSAGAALRAFLDSAIVSTALAIGTLYVVLRLSHLRAALGYADLGASMGMFCDVLIICWLLLSGALRTRRRMQAAPLIFLVAACALAVGDGALVGRSAREASDHWWVPVVAWSLGAILLGLGAVAARAGNRDAPARTEIGTRGEEAIDEVDAALPGWQSLVPSVCLLLIGVLLIVAGDDRAHPAQLRTIAIGTGILCGLILARQVAELLDGRARARGVGLLQAAVQALYRSNVALAAANRQLEVVATTDPLTGLASRSLLFDRLERAVALAIDANQPLALLLMDLDGFKEVNDTLGHYCGDLLLQQVGERLQRALRSADTVSRLGGDEFALLLPATDQTGAVEVARALQATFEAPFLLEGHPVAVGSSIGIALFPRHGVDPHTLLRCADVAMYVAKRAKSGHAVYTAGEDRHSPQRLTLAHDLRQAIAGSGLLLEYQPKVSLMTQRVVGVEALVRWEHPAYGRIQPDQFIPLAEHGGLIVPLTGWVLEEAMRQCRTWNEQGRPLGVAVNLSTRVLHEPHLPEQIASLLTRFAVEPSLLTLEITESMLMADPMQALEVITRLDALGVRIAIDDFGTGYSSLGYLKRLPVDEVKIDKGFVLGLGSVRAASTLKDRLIVRSVTALVHALGLEVVAEGVETRAVWELLLGLRCNTAQGFFVSRPLSVPDLERWLHAPFAHGE